MTTQLKLSTRRGSDGIPVVTAAGEIDLSNADSFRDALGQAAPDGGRFVVDLTAGLTVLFTHLSQIQLIAGPLLAPVLTISGLAGITSVREPQDQDGNA
jgi:anti-sigma B factor antagonist